MKDARWFRHDSDASDDEKLIALRADYGWEGNGWYWYIIEQMRCQENYRLDLSNKLLVGKLADKLRISRERLNLFLAQCCEDYMLFERQDNMLFSRSLIERMTEYDWLRMKKVESGRLGSQKRWGKGLDSENKSKVPELKTRQKQAKNEGADRVPYTGTSEKGCNNSNHKTAKTNEFYGGAIKNDSTPIKNHSTPIVFDSDILTNRSIDLLGKPELKNSGNGVPHPEEVQEISQVISQIKCDILGTRQKPP